mmetsp:Transcript_40433/g.46356  ORF Transcript_40433/g.46356 Transcript_40433/m.46356 type:complete len:456 (+) Transcript_40433:53-1420(+)
MYRKSKNRVRDVAVLNSLQPMEYSYFFISNECSYLTLETATPRQSFFDAKCLTRHPIHGLVRVQGSKTSNNKESQKRDLSADFLSSNQARIWKLVVRFLNFRDLAILQRISVDLHTLILESREIWIDQICHSFHQNDVGTFLAYKRYFIFEGRPQALDIVDEKRNTVPQLLNQMSREVLSPSASLEVLRTIYNRRLKKVIRDDENERKQGAHSDYVRSQLLTKPAREVLEIFQQLQQLSCDNCKYLAQLHCHVISNLVYFDTTDQKLCNNCKVSLKSHTDLQKTDLNGDNMFGNCLDIDVTDVQFETLRVQDQSWEVILASSLTRYLASPGVFITYRLSYMVKQILSDPDLKLRCINSTTMNSRKSSNNDSQSQIRKATGRWFSPSLFRGSKPSTPSSVSLKTRSQSPNLAKDMVRRLTQLVIRSECAMELLTMKRLAQHQQEELFGLIKSLLVE